MEFDWDNNKAESNLKKHGIDFEDAIYIFDGHTHEWEDDRHDYGETRFVALGLLDGRVLAVVYTDRDDVRRIISARRAKRHEQRAYYQTLARQPPQKG